MTGSSELVLFDTNILVFAHDTRSPNFEKAKHLQGVVNESKLKGAITPQNLLEFYSVVTKPGRIEQILTQTQAIAEIRKYLLSPFELIFPKGNEMQLALFLMKGKKVAGRGIFDIYLVATMLSNGVKTIYTQNEKDFKIFEDIKVVNPFK